MHSNRLGYVYDTVRKQAFGVNAADIVKRSGILRGHDSSTGASNGGDQATSVPHKLQDEVDYAMRRLANYLLTGEWLHQQAAAPIMHTAFHLLILWLYSTARKT